jgi:hypothetical protein
VFGLCLWSCSRNSTDKELVQAVNEKVITNKNNEFTLQTIDLIPKIVGSDKFLEFANQDDFLSTIKNLKEKGEQSLNLWEKQRDFISIRSIREQYIASLTQLIDNLGKEEKNLSPKAKQDLSSKIVTDLNTSLKIHHGLISFTQEGGIELRITNYDYGYVLNANGIVKIGKSIYQFTEDYVRIIVDGDISKIPLLLNLFSSGDTNQIIVQKIKKIVKQSPYQSGRVEDFSESCTGTNGDYRLILYEEYTSWCANYIYPYCVSETCNYQMKFRSLKKNWLGFWLDYSTTNLYGNGSYRVGPGEPWVYYNIPAPFTSVSTYTYSFGCPSGISVPCVSEVCSANHYGYGPEGSQCPIIRF